ncbi:MAG: TetR family transcriptional regulator [Sphingomonas sp.]
MTESDAASKHAGDTVSHDVKHAGRQARAADARANPALRRALLALLERKPFERITVRDITAEAGVHYATFFRHHPTKQALLDHVAADQIDGLVALALAVLDRFDSHASVSALFTHIGERRALWSALLTGGAAGRMRDELLRIARAVAAERAPAHRAMPLDLAVNYSVGLIVETLVWWLARPEDATDVEALAKTLHRLLAAVEQAEPEAAIFR